MNLNGFTARLESGQTPWAFTSNWPSEVLIWREKGIFGIYNQHFVGPQRDNASLSHGAGGDGYRVIRRRIRRLASYLDFTSTVSFKD